MTDRRSRQGPPDAEAEGMGPASEEELAEERAAHRATRERAERAEALVAETRSQAEQWVDESRARMDQTIAEARHELESELAEVRAELAGERALRLELEQRLHTAGVEPQPEPDPAPEPDGPPSQVESATGGGCSVCTRSEEGLSASQLMSAGWIVEGDERVCPRCREAGWQLAPGMDSPFRRYSDRRTSGQSGEAPDRTASSQTSAR